MTLKGQRERPTKEVKKEPVIGRKTGECGVLETKKIFSWVDLTVDE